MKKLAVTLILFISIITSSIAQTFNYQILIHDQQEELVVNTATRTSISIQFADGTSYDTLDIVQKTNEYGLLSIAITIPSFIDKNWEKATMSLLVVNNDNPNIIYAKSQARPLVAVAHALSVNENVYEQYLNKQQYIQSNLIEQQLKNTMADLHQQIEQVSVIQNCDDVKNCMIATIGNGNSTINQAMDTIATNTTGNYLILNNYTTQENTQKNIHDSIINNISRQIKDSIIHCHQQYKIRNCEDVNHCVLSSIQNKQSSVRQTVDTITEYQLNSYIPNHSTTQTQVNQTIHDSLINLSNIALTDTIANINQCLQNIQNNSSSHINKTALCTTMQTQCTDIAWQNSNNALTGNNTIASNNTFGNNNTTTVLEGTVIIPSGLTTFNDTIPCSITAVNSCDLRALFDSIYTQINNLKHNINLLRDSANNLLNATQPIFRNLSFTDSDKTITINAIFDDGGAKITSYGFYVFSDDKMINPQFFITDSPQYTFADLIPNHHYYIVATATNRIGTTESTIFNHYVEPTFPKLLQNVPAQIDYSSISSEETLLYTGGADSAQVSVYVYQDEEHLQPVFQTSSMLTQAPQMINTTITGLKHSTTYYYMIVADNQYRQDTVLTNITTNKKPLLVTSNASDTIFGCGNIDTTILYTVELLNIQPTDCQWIINGKADTVHHSDTIKVKYNSASISTGYHTIICTAEGISDTLTTTFIVNPNAQMTLTKEDETNTSYKVVQQQNKAYCTSFVWKNAKDEIVSTDLSLSSSNIITGGTYTVYGTNPFGCTTSQTIKLNNSVPFPCSIAYLRTSSDNRNREWGHTEENKLYLDSVSDHEGNVYKVVQVGAQCWLAENMRCVTSPRSGQIMNGIAMKIDSCTTFEAYPPQVFNCIDLNPYDGSAAYKALHKDGYLYNWLAAMDTMPPVADGNYEMHRGICPEGWHLATDQEWFILEKRVLSNPYWENVVSAEESNNNRSDSYGAGRLTTSRFWEQSSTESCPGNYNYSERNKFGFNVRPFDMTGWSDDCSDFGREAHFWTATGEGCFDDGYSEACNRDFYNDECRIYRNYNGTQDGYSVRCLRDDVTFEELRLTDSSTTSLTLSLNYTGLQVSKATLSLYSDQACTLPVQSYHVDLKYSQNNVSALITGLTPLSTYYAQIALSIDTLTTTLSGGPFHTPQYSLSIIADTNLSTASMCPEDTLTITYQAIIEGATTDLYQWKVSGTANGKASGNIFKVKYYDEDTYTVSCTAAGITTKKKLSLKLLTPATLSLCQDCEDQTVIVKSHNCNTIIWKNQNDSIISTSKQQIKISNDIPAGFYTVTGTNNVGCRITKEIDLMTSKSNYCYVYDNLNSGQQLSESTLANKEYGYGNRLDSVSDHQGNIYKVTQIGAQCWLAENMRCTTSPNGYLKLGNRQNSYYYAYYYNTNTDIPIRQRGYFYNWVGALDTTNGNSITQQFINRRGICPQGWHIPSDAEWFILEKEVLSQMDNYTESNMGTGQRGTGLVKLSGGCYWNEYDYEDYAGNYNHPKRNITGFSAIPIGYYDTDWYSQRSNHSSAEYWSSTSATNNNSWYRYWYYYFSGLYRGPVDKRGGKNVRCVRDGGNFGKISITDSTRTSISTKLSYTNTSISSASLSLYTDSTYTTPVASYNPDIRLNNNNITSTITGLTPHTSYYMKIAATTDTGVVFIHGGPLTTALYTLDIVADTLTTKISICPNDTFTVTYTALVDGTTTDTYQWKVSGNAKINTIDNKLIVSYTKDGDYTITCSAVGIKATTEMKVQMLNEAYLSLCEDCESASITIIDGNCDNIIWKNAQGDIVSTNNSHLQMSSNIPAGTYTVTGINYNGCQITKEAEIQLIENHHSCLIANTLNSGSTLTKGLFANKEFGVGSQLDSVSDHQGNIYKVTQIGAQCWLAENMRCTTSPNGYLTVGNGKSSSYIAYYYSNLSNTIPLRQRGYLYNWAGALDTTSNKSITEKFINRRGICPQGWHVPTDTDWFVLEKEVLTNMTSYSETYMGTGHRGRGVGKLSGSCYWYNDSYSTYPGNYNYAERNSTGFTAVPAGYAQSSYNGNVKSRADFWSATTNDANNSWYRYWYYYYDGIERTSNSKSDGRAVRCVRN